jgi:hypothetical protein
MRKNKKPTPEINSQEIPLSSFVKRKSSSLFRIERELGVITILSLESSHIFELRGAGAYLWAHLDGTRTVEELIGTLSKDIGLSRSKFRTFASGLVRSLFLENLVELLVERSSPRSKDSVPLDSINKKNWAQMFDLKPLPHLSNQEAAAASLGPGCAISGCASIYSCVS